MPYKRKQNTFAHAGRATMAFHAIERAPTGSKLHHARQASAV